MESLELAIRQMGAHMAACSRSCAGVLNSPADGVPPRGLMLELRGDDPDDGVIVVGMNPGRAFGKPEARHYQQNSGAYEQQLIAWHGPLNICNVDYFRVTRGFLSGLGLKGSILWTDVAKCECPKGASNVPHETLMECSRQFLVHELRAAPGHWPIIALGRRAYEGVGFMAGDRAVVGVPHPTGSHGDYARLCRGDVIEPSALEIAWKALGEGGRVWLRAGARTT